MRPRSYAVAPPGMDPARGSFTPLPSRQRGPLRPGKTRQDRQPVERRKRVEAARARRGS